MVGSSSNSNRSTPKKRALTKTNLLVRAKKDGSGFVKCEECSKDVPAAIIEMHTCSRDAKNKMKLETEVVEMAKEVKKPVVRKRTASSRNEESKSKKEKELDAYPKTAKRPANAFIIFMEDFRPSYKDQHPDSKGGADVSREGGLRWRSMSDEEKKPYNDKAAKRKEEYSKAMEKLNAGNDEEKENSDKEAEHEEAEKPNAGEDDVEKESSDKNEENEDTEGKSNVGDDDKEVESSDKEEE